MRAQLNLSNYILHFMKTTKKTTAMFDLPSSRWNHPTTISSSLSSPTKKPGTFADKFVSEWTKEDLVDWAKFYRYEEAPDKFLLNEWDGMSLLYVTLQDLLDLGIKRGESKSIETRISALLQKDTNVNISPSDIAFSQDLLFGPSNH